MSDLENKAWDPLGAMDSDERPVLCLPMNGEDRSPAGLARLAHEVALVLQGHRPGDFDVDAAWITREFDNSKWFGLYDQSVQSGLDAPTARGVGDDS